MNPLFSIIVPVYKVEQYINECVDNILKQTYENFELILVDDGSPDRCPSICDEYKEKDSRVVVIHKNNEGVSRARADGVEKSRGQYLVFCDSDDLLCPDALQAVEKIISEYEPDEVLFDMTTEPSGFVLKNSGLFYERKDIEKKIFPYLLENKYGSYFDTSLWDGAYKRELYISNQVKDCKIEIGEDLACKKAVTYNAQSLYIMDDVLYYYRPNQLSATKSKKMFLWDGPELIGKHIEAKIDLNSFDMREQLYRVVTHQLFLVVKSQFNRSDSYNAIKKDIEENIRNPYYCTAINNCKYSPKYLKGIVAKYSLKYRFYNLMRVFCKLGL
jgi:glycosyltransferase involved in cell wall biosynthesis